MSRIKAMEERAGERFGRKRRSRRRHRVWKGENTIRQIYISAEWLEWVSNQVVWICILDMPYIKNFSTSCASVTLSIKEN